MSLPSDEQTALLWPIQAKGAVTRLNPLGDPQVETIYHNAMEQGRFLERNIADANNWLLQKKILLTNQIQTYTHMNSLAVDGQLGHTPRVPKYVADSISILKTAQQFQQEIVQLVAAIEQNIQMIIAIEQSMLAMVTNVENSLANLLNNVCNWGLPALPSMPNLFSNGIWNWNGFQFSPLALFAALKSNTNFNFNFTLANCSLGSTAPSNLFLGNPLTITTDSGLTYSSPENYDPPLSGTQTDPTQDLNDPAFISQMQGQNTPPVYNPSFNPNTEMYGAVPDPHQIISNYQMPAATYTADIVSICPLLRSNTVFVTDPDYLAPEYAVRQPQLRKDLLHMINLAGIVQSNYDPFVMSAWLLYLAAARAGRGGVWIPNFEAVYQMYIQPSVSTLSTQSVPWNDVLPGTANILWMGTWDSTTSYVPNDVVVFNGVNYIALLANTGAEPDTSSTDWGTAPANSVYSDAPAIPLITTFQGLPQNQLFHLLWQLSYIEASLLSYSRNATWDTNQDTSYLTGPTGNTLDYVPTVTTGTMSNFTLGAGVAEFPVPITFPTAIKTVMDEVIAIATTNIDNDLTYLSPRLGNRYVYNQFAIATQVDRYSQFWRDFATNLTNFLAQGPYLVQFAVTYSDILDGALDPLASSANRAAFASLLADVATRNRTWTPGTPLLNIPIQPVTGLTNNSTPNVNNNGWTMPPTDLDPMAFLARPDISVLPIPVQTAMLRTNLSYAGVNVWAQQMQASISTNLANANALLTATQTIGFQVEVATDSITQTSVQSNVMTFIVNNSYQTGDLVLIEDTTVTPAVNGQVLTVLVASATQFTAAFTTGNYSLTSDTGETGLVTNVPSGSAGIAINFDTIDFDFTGNVTTLRPGLFTIQAAGTYNGIASINFNVLNATGDTVSIAVMQNGNVIATGSSTVSSPSQVVASATFVQEFNTDDVVQIFAYASNAPEQVIFGSTFNMVQSSSTGGSSTPTNMNDETRTYTMDVPFWLTSPIPFLTIVEIDAAGNATPIDPTVPAITNVAITTNVLTITAANHLSVGDLITFSGVGTATFLNGTTATVATLIGVSPNYTGFTASYTHATYASTADTGSVLYAIDSSGAVLAPNPDGVTLTAASDDGNVTVGVLYGGQYQIAGTGTFTPGALLYAGPGGVITQDYTTLITQVGWILCIGRVTAFDVPSTTVTFIYEPHIATRFSIMI